MKNVVFWNIKSQFIPHRKYYVSDAEPSYGGEYEERRLLECEAVWLLLEPTFRRNVSLLSSGWQE
jgi:hypothetical protein